MALTPGANLNVSGSLTAPKFIRLAIVGHTLEANASIKQMVNVLDFFCPAPAPGGGLGAFNASVQGIIETLYLACLASTYTLDYYTSRYLDNPMSIPSTLTVGTAGSVATDRAASFTSAAIRKLTTVPSRNFRGAMHVGALPEAFTTTDHLNATGLTAYNALDAALAGMVTTGPTDSVNTWFPILISTTLSDLFSSPAVVSYAAIVNFVTNERIGTMKRRKERTPI